MATVRKSCQAEDNEKCQNEARALCYHCSRDLCIDHLTEHSQLVDALTRSSLNDYFTTLTNLSLRLQSLTISTKILDDPFLKLEQWRIDAYHQIDEIVKKKFEEIQMKIDEYRQIFDKIRNEQLERMTRYKQKIADLFRKSQVANKDLSHLRKSIEQIENDLNIFDKHSIEVTSNRPLIHPIHIQIQINNWKSSNHSSSSSSTSSSLSSIIHQLEFRLKYVRLSGIVTNHYILVEVNGTIADLIDQFINTQDQTIMIKPKRDCFLAMEISQHRVRQKLTNDIQLKTIFNKIDELILYETPFELNSIYLQQYCLILCTFEDGLPWNIQFGLPILLHVPRFQCRGRDLINTLDKTIQICFPSISTNNNIHYEVKIVSDDHQMNTTTILNQWEDELIDDHLIMADNATLIVNLINTNDTLIKDQKTRLARLDGTLKSSEKRRKSRK